MVHRRSSLVESFVSLIPFLCVRGRREKEKKRKRGRRRKKRDEDEETEMKREERQANRERQEEEEEEPGKETKKKEVEGKGETARHRRRKRRKSRGRERRGGCSARDGLDNGDKKDEAEEAARTRRSVRRREDFQERTIQIFIKVDGCKALRLEVSPNDKAGDVVKRISSSACCSRHDLWVTCERRVSKKR